MLEVKIAAELRRAIGEGEARPGAGTSERRAVLARARELVAFARRQGYRREELIQIIETLAD